MYLYLVNCIRLYDLMAPEASISLVARQLFSLDLLNDNWNGILLADYEAEEEKDMRYLGS